MVILMSNFNVISNNTSYKYTEHPYKIRFDGFATTRRSNTFDGNVNKIGFEVTKFSDIISLNVNRITCWYVIQSISTILYNVNIQFTYSQIYFNKF